MFLVTTTGVLFIILFITFFIFSYYVVLGSNVEKLFKQGHIWEIRAFQVMLALILGFIIACAITKIIEVFN